MTTQNFRKLILIILSFLILCIVIVHKVYGEPIAGQDELALQYPPFDTQSAARYNNHSRALGILDYTFDSSLTHVDSLLSDNDYSHLRVHILNGTCVANRNCGPYEPVKDYNLKTLEAAILKKDPKLLGFVAARTKLYCALKTKYPKLKLLISPILEHRLGTKAYRILADTVLNNCGDVQLVNNPVTGDGEKYKGAWIESHDGFKKPRAIVSFDGLDATDANIDLWKKTTANSKIAFVWSRVYNCRNQGPWEDPRERTSCPLPRDFELIGRLIDNRGIAPNPRFKCSFKPFSAPYIWKPLAEDYGTNDPRSNLPVAIVPFGPVDISVVGMKGVSIGKLKYYGRFQNNLNRYYSGTSIKLSGYEIEKRIAKANGSPYAWLKSGSSCIGPFIPGKRQGAYR